MQDHKSCSSTLTSGATIPLSNTSSNRGQQISQPERLSKHRQTLCPSPQPATIADSLTASGDAATRQWLFQDLKVVKVVNCYTCYQKSKFASVQEQWAPQLWLLLRVSPLSLFRPRQVCLLSKKRYITAWCFEPWRQQGALNKCLPKPWRMPATNQKLSYNISLFKHTQIEQPLCRIVLARP